MAECGWSSAALRRTGRRWLGTGQRTTAASGRLAPHLDSTHTLSRHANPVMCCRRNPLLPPAGRGCYSRQVLTFAYHGWFELRALAGLFHTARDACAVATHY